MKKSDLEMQRQASIILRDACKSMGKKEGRYQAVSIIHESLGLSISEACRICNIPRSSYYSFQTDMSLRISSQVSKELLEEVVTSIYYEMPYLGAKAISYHVERRIGKRPCEKVIRDICSKNQLVRQHIILPTGKSPQNRRYNVEEIPILDKGEMRILPWADRYKVKGFAEKYIQVFTCDATLLFDRDSFLGEVLLLFDTHSFKVLAYGCSRYVNDPKTYNDMLDMLMESEVVQPGRCAVFTDQGVLNLARDWNTRLDLMGIIHFFGDRQPAGNATAEVLVRGFKERFYYHRIRNKKGYFDLRRELDDFTVEYNSSLYRIAKHDGRTPNEVWNEKNVR